MWKYLFKKKIFTTHWNPRDLVVAQYAARYVKRTTVCSHYTHTNLYKFNTKERELYRLDGGAQLYER